MLCCVCGKPIKLPDTGELDQLATWGDLCDECADSDVAAAIAAEERRHAESLEERLRLRPGHVRGEEGGR